MNVKRTISSSYLKLMHKVFGTINLSLLILIFILSFLSFNSQREWSNTYKFLSKTRNLNHNLIDYISKTEEFHISKLESLNSLKTTKPTDLIYLKRIEKKKENFLKKHKVNFLNGLKDSSFRRGY